MITVDQAEQAIFEGLPINTSREYPLTELFGKSLDQEITAERDGPPFDRCAMDGIAIHSKYLNKSEFILEGIQKAGESQKEIKKESNALEVMTGAPLPIGLDLVIPYEQITIKEGIAILNSNIRLKKMQNVHRLGTDFKKGETLLVKGVKLNAPQIAVAVSQGFSSLKAKSISKVAIVSSGDELIDLDSSPLPHQIRKSNPYAIQSELRAIGYKETKLFHLNDEFFESENLIKGLLGKYSILILSGGVSKGKFDLLPEVFKKLQVKKIFHRITQRPGKPFWFGKGLQEQLVFALPGNPVSSLICMRRYVIPALKKLETGKAPPLPFATLQEDITFEKELTLFKPVKVTYSPDGKTNAWPITLNGSGDYFSLAASDGFLELPMDKKHFFKGEAYPFYPWGTNE
jgi:molybdopterin molybdotransferase